MNTNNLQGTMPDTRGSALAHLLDQKLPPPYVMPPWIIKAGVIIGMVLPTLLGRSLPELPSPFNWIYLALWLISFFVIAFTIPYIHDAPDKTASAGRRLFLCRPCQRAFAP